MAQHLLLVEAETETLLIDITSLNPTTRILEGMEIVRMGIADFKIIHPFRPFLIQARL